MENYSKSLEMKLKTTHRYCFTLFILTKSPHGEAVAFIPCWEWNKVLLPFGKQYSYRHKKKKEILPLIQ